MNSKLYPKEQLPAGMLHSVLRIFKKIVIIIFYRMIMHEWYSDQIVKLYQKETISTQVGYRVMGSGKSFGFFEAHGNFLNLQRKIPAVFIG